MRDLEFGVNGRAGVFKCLAYLTLILRLSSSELAPGRSRRSRLVEAGAPFNETVTFDKWRPACTCADACSAPPDSHGLQRPCALPVVWITSRLQRTPAGVEAAGRRSRRSAVLRSSARPGLSQL
jgi:hypothetical protein